MYYRALHSGSNSITIPQLHSGSNSITTLQLQSLQSLHNHTKAPHSGLFQYNLLMGQKTMTSMCNVFVNAFSSNKQMAVWPIFDCSLLWTVVCCLVKFINPPPPPTPLAQQRESVKRYFVLALEIYETKQYTTVLAHLWFTRFIGVHDCSVILSTAA